MRCHTLLNNNDEDETFPEQDIHRAVPQHPCDGPKCWCKQFER